jgi:predicted RNA binding protein YcfA (HicA-like mRNA interferase family)
MHSRDIIKILETDGWILKRITGSHHHFVHPMKTGLVTVAHPKPDIPVGTVKSIERQSGLQIWRTT